MYLKFCALLFVCMTFTKFTVRPNESFVYLQSDLDRDSGTESDDELDSTTVGKF